MTDKLYTVRWFDEEASIWRTEHTDKLPPVNKAYMSITFNRVITREQIDAALAERGL